MKAHDQIALGLVRALMEDRGWKPDRLARELGCSADLVRRWLRGERKVPLDKLAEIARAGGYSLDATFGLLTGVPELHTSAGKIIAAIIEQELALAHENIAGRIGATLGLEMNGAGAMDEGMATRGNVPNSASDAKHYLSIRAQESLDAIRQATEPVRTATRKNVKRAG